MSAPDPFTVYRPPFRYEGRGGFIVDAAGQRVLDMRGWGYLSTSFGPTVAADLQDAVAAEVVRALDARWSTVIAGTFRQGAGPTGDKGGADG